MMKKLTYIAVIVGGIGLSSCTSGGGVPVSGKVENVLAGEPVTLNEYAIDGLRVVDTIKIGEDGSFAFYADPDEPTFYRLNFYNRQYVNMILKGTEEEVTIEVNGTDPNDRPVVTGSEGTNHIIRIDEMMAQQKEQVQKLNQEAIQARMNSDQESLESITDRYYELVNKSQAGIKEYLWEITPSLAAFYGLNALNPDQNLTFYDSLAARFSKELPGHFFTKDLVSRVDALKNLSVGSVAPEISLPTPDGSILTLSSFRGNYVLIDFWAAWCRPCRAENPNVVRMYKKYRDKNFEILGVSLDRTKEAWVRAIEEDGLIWKHVSDLKYFNSEAAATYKINAIPATYLIDPEGRIIAKGLRGASLEAKLEEIFG